MDIESFAVIRPHIDENIPSPSPRARVIPRLSHASLFLWLSEKALLRHGRRHVRRYVLETILFVTFYPVSCHAQPIP